MIRMNPAHDTVNPPGCTIPGQQNVIHQEKTLEKEIDAYQRGFQDGFTAKNGWIISINRSSEFDR